MHRIVFAGLAIVAGLTLVSQAHATPQPLPFTYTTETLDEGDMEVEQYVDLTPVRGALSTGAQQWYLASQFQTEFEYGLGHRLELGLYVTYAPSAPTGLESTAVLTEGTGVKERLRYTLADPGEWPIDVGVYGELVENDHELEIEAKILLQRRFGKLRLDTNLWAEYEFYLDPPGHRDVVLNPTVGATYEVTPAVHLGVEGWMRAELTNQTIVGARPFSLLPHEFVGPVVMLNFGKLWWSTGFYVRADHFDHVTEAIPVQDNYGPVWARTIIGYEL